MALEQKMRYIWGPLRPFEDIWGHLRPFEGVLVSWVTEKAPDIQETSPFQIIEQLLINSPRRIVSVGQTNSGVTTWTWINTNAKLTQRRNFTVTMSLTSTPTNRRRSFQLRLPSSEPLNTNGARWSNVNYSYIECMCLCIGYRSTSAEERFANRGMSDGSEQEPCENIQAATATRRSRQFNENSSLSIEHFRLSRAFHSDRSTGQPVKQIHDVPVP